MVRGKVGVTQTKTAKGQAKAEATQARTAKGRAKVGKR